MHLAGIYRACLFGVSRGVAILIFKEQHREIDDGGVRFHGTFGPDSDGPGSELTGSAPPSIKLVRFDVDFPESQAA